MQPGSEEEDFGETSHGIAGWPFGPPDTSALPPILPDGTPWPLLQVIVLGEPGTTGLAATLASVRRQDHPNLRCEVVKPDRSAFAEMLADEEIRSILPIRAGDLLAPGALSALALEAALTNAPVVVGLRVLFDRGVLALDVVGQPPGPMNRLSSLGPGDVPMAPCGDCLLDGDIVRTAGGFDPASDAPMIDLWNRLAALNVRFARIGRPVLLQRYAAERMPPTPEGLSIVALTDTGYLAGAGIAHRRLTEALSLANHRITHLTLTSETPAAAAEWTETFPKTEARIAAGDHDLVLAGNLHGATRNIGLLARIGADLPVAAILHDLFPLTGRCAFPQGCSLIVTGCDSRCPSPDEYPQLERGRISDAYVRKRAILGASGAPLLLANSAWTAAAARTLAPHSTEVEEISLAFPTGVFRPGDRPALRQRLGLPLDDIIVMFGAVIVDAPGKGFADLSAAVKAIARPGIRFVAAGRLDDPSVYGLPDLITTGPIADESVLAEWYAASDLYITASLTETLGQTPIEAGLCGTPTVAYRSCGLTTAVIDGISGLLAPVRVSDLVTSVERLIADKALRHNLGAWGRISLENRNSYAAAALRMHDVMKPRLGGPRQDRILFSPKLIGSFAFAAIRHPGHTATVRTSANPLVPWLRRLKHQLLGRGLPVWLRRLLYFASVLRRGRTGSLP